MILHLVVFLYCVQKVDSFGVKIVTEFTEYGLDSPILNKDFSYSWDNNVNIRYPLNLRLIQLPLQYHNRLFIGVSCSETYELCPKWIRDYKRLDSAFYTGCGTFCHLTDTSSSCKCGEDKFLGFSNSTHVSSNRNHGFFVHYDPESEVMYSIEFPNKVDEEVDKSSFLFRRFLTFQNGTVKHLYHERAFIHLNSTYEEFDIHSKGCDPVDMIKVNSSVFFGASGKCQKNPAKFDDFPDELAPYTRIVGFEDDGFNISGLLPNETFTPVEYLGKAGQVRYFDELVHIDLKVMLRWKKKLVLVGNTGKVVVMNSYLKKFSEHSLGLFSSAEHRVIAVIRKDTLYIVYTASTLKPVFLSMDLSNPTKIVKREMDESLSPMRFDILEDSYLFLICEEMVMQLDLLTLSVLRQTNILFFDSFFKEFGKDVPGNYRRDYWISKSVPPDFSETSTYRVYEYNVMESWRKINPTGGDNIYSKGISTSFHSLKLSLCKPGASSKPSVNFGVCDNCDEGTYILVSGQPTCTAGCELGTYPNFTSTSGEVCVPCPKGYYSDENILSVSECKPCGKGTYSDVEGIDSASKCTPCPPGTVGIYVGSISSSSCSPCGNNEECPRGSAVSYTSNQLSIEESTEYAKIDEVLISELWNILSKVIILAVLIHVGCCCICCVLCVSCIRIGKYAVCPLRCFDCFYNMYHDVSEGKSPIKRSTMHGGCCSVIAVFVALFLIICSLFDFAFQNTVTNQSITIGVENDETLDASDVITHDKWVSGLYTSTISAYGNFDSCSKDLITSSFTTTGFSGLQTFSCERMTVNQIGNFYSSGCSCRWVCEDCKIESSTMKISLKLNTGGQMIKGVLFRSTFPHFDEEEEYFVEGSVYQDTETLKTVTPKFSLFKTKKVSYSYLNLISQIVDYTHNLVSYGILASVLSNDRTKDPNPQNSLDVELVYSLSIFQYQIVERQRQSLLSLMAQITALFSLAISIVGILYSCFCENPIACTRCLICRFFCCRKSMPISDFFYGQLGVAVRGRKRGKIKGSSVGNFELMAMHLAKSDAFQNFMREKKFFKKNEQYVDLEESGEDDDDDDEPSDYVKEEEHEEEEEEEMKIQEFDIEEKKDEEMIEREIDEDEDEDECRTDSDSDMSFKDGDIRGSLEIVDFD